MKRLWAWVGRHRLLVGSAVFLGIGLVLFVLIWFQPQKLFINDTVNEGVPGGMVLATEPEEGEGDTESDPGGGPEVLGKGRFRSLAHEGSGRAILIRLPTGKEFLRFENLNVENGPDLRVYLSTAPSTADEDLFNENFVDLGGLKGNLGDQNYRVPANVDVAKFRSAVVWCRRFSVGFAVAPIG